MISLLKNPLNGGIPEIDIDAINDVADVAGIDLAKSAHLLQIACTNRVFNCSGIKKQKSFKSSMINKMEKSSGNCQGCNLRLSPREIRIIPIPTERITYPIWLIL